MESAPPLRVAFAGAFAARLEAPVRSHLDVPCDVIVDDERGIVSRLADVDVLVTMAFTPEMAAACRRLKLVRCPAPVSIGSSGRRYRPVRTWPTLTVTTWASPNT